MKNGQTHTQNIRLLDWIGLVDRFDENILKYLAEPNGLCQNTSKAASLFSNPRICKDIAEEENRYLLEHFEHFEPGYAWPHTILIRSGAKKTFKNKEEFNHFLAKNPDASYMWGDHQQLQITSNRYQAKVNVLNIYPKGNGSIMNTPCTSDPALQEFSLLPEGTDSRISGCFTQAWTTMML